MSVFTELNARDLQAVLNGYDIGALKDFQGIQEGIENTNYFVSTSLGEYVLTIFENHKVNEMPFYLELMMFLHNKGVATPPPMLDRQGNLQTIIKDKPAAIVNRVNGKNTNQPNAEQQKTVVINLARMHEVAKHYHLQRPNDRNLDWMQTVIQQMLTKVSQTELQLLLDELDFQKKIEKQFVGLPFGIVHADIFKDNVLFDGNRLAGIIDWYYSGNSYLLYDMAVFVNDWCRCGDEFSSDMFDERKIKFNLEEYNRYRCLTQLEKELWPAMCRRAALRFCVSRMQDYVFRKQGKLISEHDPFVFFNILQYHQTYTRSITFL